MFFHKNTKMFTFSGLRSSLYFSLKTQSYVFHCFLNIHVIFAAYCVHLCARADEASINQALHLKHSHWSASLHMISGILLLLQCMKHWSSTNHALAQMRPHQIWTRTFSKNGPVLHFNGALILLYSLRSSVPIHCNCIEKSDQHNLQNCYFCSLQKKVSWNQQGLSFCCNL